MRRRPLLFWLDRVVLVVLLTALIGCGGTQRSSVNPEVGAPSESSAPGGIALPGLPGLDGTPLPLKLPSYANTIYSAGNAIWDSFGDDNVFTGNALVLRSSLDKPAWADYRYNPAGYQPSRISLGLDVSANAQAWIGVTHYGSGRWRWFSASGDQVITLPPGDWLSADPDPDDLLPERYCTVKVLAHGGADVSVRYVTLEYDNEIEPEFSIAGVVTDEHGQPVPGLGVTVNPGFQYSYTDLDGAYLLAVTAAGAHDVSVDEPSGAWTFTPPVLNVNVVGNETGQDFSGSRIDVRGQILDGSGAGVAGVQVTLDPPGSTATTGADGGYVFQGVMDGLHTVTPLLAGYTFDPADRQVTVAGADEDVAAITATGGQPTFSISGTILDGGTGVDGVTVTLMPGWKTAQTNALGFYSFTGLANGVTYTVTPHKSFWTFAPSARNVLVDGSSVPNTDFAATPPPPGYDVSGQVTDFVVSGNPGVPDVELQLRTSPGNALVGTVQTSPTGAWAFSNVPSGDYKVTATKFDYAWVGSNSIDLMVNNANVSGLAFSGAFAAGPTWNNFAASLVSSRCLSCHRPDSGTAVDPYMRTYDEVQAAGVAHNARIQAGTMPPGSPLNSYYKGYFSLWRDAGFPLD